MDRLGPDVPLHFTAFHPDWKLTDSPPTPPRTLRMARQIATDAGLHYVYPAMSTIPPAKPPTVPGAARCSSAATGTTSRRGISMRTGDVPRVRSAATEYLKLRRVDGARAVSR